MNVEEPLKNTKRANEHIDTAIVEIKRVADELSNPRHHRDLKFLTKELDESETLPKVLTENILKHYKLAIETELVNHSSISELVGGITYHVCRENDIPRTLEEVAYVCLSEMYPPEDREMYVPKPAWMPYMKELSRMHRRVCSTLNINATPVTPKAYVKRYTNELNVDDEVEEVAMTILNVLDSSVYSGVPSNTYAAATVQYALDQTNTIRTAREVCRTLNVSPDGIRKQRDKIKEMLESGSS